MIQIREVKDHREDNNVSNYVSKRTGSDKIRRYYGARDNGNPVEKESKVPYGYLKISQVFHKCGFSQPLHCNGP